MNFLPESIENIIVDYKNQMEHKEKFSSCLERINEIIHVIDEDYMETKICKGDNIISYCYIRTQCEEHGYNIIDYYEGLVATNTHMEGDIEEVNVMELLKNKNKYEFIEDVYYHM